MLVRPPKQTVSTRPEAMTSKTALDGTTPRQRRKGTQGTAAAARLTCKLLARAGEVHRAQKVKGRRRKAVEGWPRGVHQRGDREGEAASPPKGTSLREARLVVHGPQTSLFLSFPPPSLLLSASHRCT